ncbi:MAG: pirin family protein [Ignavibacteriae bacterium]|nr:MAG: pirin family protein [Ignavibacteriota bacterium]
MKKTIHKANSRGLANHGWLLSRHTFSFAGYHDPERIRFGLLRVLNDDIVAPGMGFGEHPHDNMEIVSIPLKGELAHKDSEGHEKVIYTNDVQIMSAGSGLTHSEYNHSKENEVNFLQIWVFPKERNIKPRYDQKTFSPEKRKNIIQTVVSPEKNNGTLWINQDAYFSLSKLDAGKELTYNIERNGNGLYVFVIEGEIETSGEKLSKRDAIGLEDIENVDIKAVSGSEILLIEVPMQ